MSLIRPPVPTETKRRFDCMFIFPSIFSISCRWNDSSSIRVEKKRKEKKGRSCPCDCVISLLLMPFELTQTPFALFSFSCNWTELSWTELLLYHVRLSCKLRCDLKHLFSFSDENDDFSRLLLASSNEMSWAELTTVLRYPSREIWMKHSTAQHRDDRSHKLVAQDVASSQLYQTDLSGWLAAAWLECLWQARLRRALCLVQTRASKVLSFSLSPLDTFQWPITCSLFREDRSRLNLKGALGESVQRQFLIRSNRTKPNIYVYLSFGK